MMPSDIRKLQDSLYYMAGNYGKLITNIVDYYKLL